MQLASKAISYLLYTKFNKLLNFRIKNTPFQTDINTAATAISNSHTLHTNKNMESAALFLVYKFIISDANNIKNKKHNKMDKLILCVSLLTDKSIVWMSAVNQMILTRGE